MEKLNAGCFRLEPVSIPLRQTVHLVSAYIDISITAACLYIHVIWSHWDYMTMIIFKNLENFINCCNDACFHFSKWSNFGSLRRP